VGHFDPDFCFYDDPDLPENEDADEWSPLLRQRHRELWNKSLPTGEVLDLTADLTVESPIALRGLRLSSDTIANAHQRYLRSPAAALWDALPPAEQRRYDRGFYRIGAFIVFPCHSQSVNQRRGTSGQIYDRFDLTLECIRLYYEGGTAIERNPLGDVLRFDSKFFHLFGYGVQGFNSYVEFFHLEDLVDAGRIRWFDDFDGPEWIFSNAPLPKTQAAYRRYLDNVLRFVDNRSRTIAAAMSLSDSSPRPAHPR
jgi:hypothetical protein